MLSVSLTAPPSLVECKHWGGRTHLRRSVWATAFDSQVYLKTQHVLLLVAADTVLVVVRREGPGDAAGLVRVINRRLVRDVILGAVVHGDLGVCTGTQHVWRTAIMHNDT